MTIGPTTSWIFVDDERVSVFGTSLLFQDIDYTQPVGNDAETYLSLITSWHRGRPRFEQVVDKSAEPLRDLQTFLGHVPQDFDLDEAIGVQLDVVGEWVGRSRFISVPIPDLYFSWDDEIRGWDKGIWKGFYDPVYGISRLDDDTYRLLLYTKIAANNWDGRVESADAALEIIFNALGGGSNLYIEDRLDNSMLFGVAQKIPSVLYLMLLSAGYIPLKPAGIKTYYVVTSVNNTPVFGFDVSNENVSGWDEGSWGVPPDYIAQNPVY